MPATADSNDVTVTTKSAGYGALSAAASLFGDGYVVLSGAGSLSAVSSIVGVGYSSHYGSGELTTIGSLVGIGQTTRIHVHLFDVAIDESGNYGVPTVNTLGTSSVAGEVHNHSNVDDLSVSDMALLAVENCTVMLLGVSNFVLSPEESMGFDIQFTPSAFGSFSFQLVVVSDDPNEPNLVLDFSGTALDVAAGYGELSAITGIVGVGESPAVGGGGMTPEQVAMLETVFALLQADIVVDYGVTPANVIWYEKGTDTEIMRKAAYDRNGAGITSRLQQLGSLIDA